MSASPWKRRIPCASSARVADAPSVLIATQLVMGSSRRIAEQKERKEKKAAVVAGVVETAKKNKI